MKTCGDLRFYFSGVRKAQEKLVQFALPASSTTDKFLFDKSRTGLYRINALMTFPFKDSRLAYAFSFTLSVLLSFCLIFLVSKFCINDNGTISAVIGLSYIFLLLPFRSLIFDGSEYFLFHIKNLITENSQIVDLESINDNFRYLVMATGNIFIPLTIYFSHIPLDKIKRRINFTLLIIFSILLIYSYPGIFIFSFPILFISHAYQLSRRKEIYAEYLFSVVVLVSLCFIFNIPQDIYNIYSNLPRLITESHFSPGSLDFKTRFFNILPLLKMNILYLALRLASTFLKTHSRERQNILNFIAIFFIIYSVLGLIGKTELFTRLFVRGGCSFLFLLILLDLGKILDSIILLKLKKVLLFASLAFFLGTINSSVAIFKRLSQNSIFEINSERWETYVWLQNNLPKNAKILALNFEDIQLIPVFTNLNLEIYSAEYGQAPEDVLKVYISALKLLGKDQKFLNKILNKYDENYLKISCNKNKETDSYNDLWPVYLVSQLIYIPYAKIVNSHAIRTSDNSHFTSDFKAFINSAWVERSPQISSNWIILDNSIYNSSFSFKSFKVAFQKGSMIVLRRN